MTCIARGREGGRGNILSEGERGGIRVSGQASGEKDTVFRPAELRSLGNDDGRDCDGYNNYQIV